MSRWIKHDPDARGGVNKSLYNYTHLNGLDDEQCHVLFLSDRDLSLVDEALQWSDHQRTRVYQSANYSAKAYLVVDDGQWSDFKRWISNLRTRLNDYDMTNQLLERIAIATEAIAGNLQYDPGDGSIGLAQMVYDFNDTLTLQELIDQMTAADGPGYNFKDILEMLIYIKELTPDMPSLSLPNVFQIWQNIKQTRINHNQTTLMAFQATALRGIQNAMAPFQEDETTDEGTMVQQIYKGLDNIPWEKIAVAAVGATVEPTPVGEASLAATSIALTVKSAWDTLKAKFSDWWNYYINQVGDPLPSQTIVGAILESKNQSTVVGSQSLTLTQIINNISNIVGDDDTVDYPDTYKTLLDVLDFLPDDFTDMYTVNDPASFIQAIMSNQNSEVVLKMAEMVEAIKCICGEMGELVAQGYNNQIIPPQSTWNSPGLYRCSAAKWYLGKTAEIFLYLRNEAIDLDAVAGAAWDDFQFVLAQTVLNIKELLGFADDVLSDWLGTFEIGQTIDSYTVLQDLQDQWLADIYGASDPDTAIAAIMATLNAHNPSGYTITQEMKDGLELFFRRSRGLERVFLNESNQLAVNQQEIDTYSGWNDQPCEVEGVWNCFPQLGTFNYGSVSPVLITSSAWNLSNYPVSTWATITSEWYSNGNDSHQRMQMVFDDAYTLEIEVLSIPAGKTLQLYVTDCDNQYMYYSQNTPTGLVYTGYADQFLAQTLPLDASNPGTFQVRFRRVT